MKVMAKLKLALCIGLGCAVIVGSFFWINNDRPKSSDKTIPNTIKDITRPDTSGPFGRVSTKSLLTRPVSKEEESISGIASDKPSIDIDLPEPYTDKAIRMILLKASAMKIWRTQDEAMETWPEYAEIKEELSNELSQGIDLAHTPNQSLVKIALELRKQFWQAGGELSQDSYRHIYKARILLELARSRNPEDLTIMDELAQTMMSADLRRKYEKDGKTTVPNEELDKTLLKIRSSQFTILKKEIDHERSPAIEDFIRTFDLAVLQSRYQKESVKKTVAWLQREASRGGWTGYNVMLSKFHDSVSRGEEYVCNIYVPTKPRIPYDFRYSRRLPSFKWPVAEERGLILWGHDGTEIPFEIVLVEEDKLSE